MIIPSLQLGGLEMSGSLDFPTDMYQTTFFELVYILKRATVRSVVDHDHPSLSSYRT